MLLTAAAFLGNGSPYRVAVILALLFWTVLARIVRGSFLSLREKEYVEAAKAAGSGDLRIMLRHILPNVVSPIVVNATLIVGIAILTEASLSFLGGIPAPTRPRSAFSSATGRSSRTYVVARHLPRCRSS